MPNGKPEVVSEDKQITRKVALAFGGQTTTERHLDSTRKLEISILCASNCPIPGVNSYATIGLWRTSLEHAPDALPVRLELVAAFPANKDGFREVLAAAAFRIIRTRKAAAPGHAFPDYVHEWYPKATVPHLFFSVPSSWEEDALNEMRMGNLEVQFLQILPISQAEYDFLLEHGEDALELKFIDGTVDFYDLKRNSVI